MLMARELQTSRKAADGNVAEVAKMGMCGGKKAQSFAISL
jgi:hypothetical protein